MPQPTHSGVSAGKKAEPVTFGLLVLAQAATAWLFPVFVTQDGAAHLENAVALTRISRAPYAQFYELNPLLQANWFSHLLLTGLSRWMNGPDVDKVMATVCLAVMPLCFRYALTRMVPRAPRTVSWAGIPFAASAIIYLGFWDYALALSLFFVVLAEVWSFRGRKGMTRAARYSAALLLLGFLHPLALAELGLTALAILSHQFGRALLRGKATILAALGRRIIRLALWSMPAGVLFVAGMDRRPGAAWWKSSLERLFKLATLHPLAVFRWYELAASFGIAICIWTVVGATLWRRRGRLNERCDSLLAGVGATLLVCLVAPEAASGGGFIGVRVVLFPFLISLLWIGSQAGRRRSLSWFGPALAAAGIVLIVMRIPAQQQFNTYVAEYRSAARSIPEGSLVVPVAAFRQDADMSPASRSSIVKLRDRVMAYDPESARRRMAYSVNPLLHAIGYDAAEHHLIDAGNYEVLTMYFPLTARNSVAGDLEKLFDAIEAKGSPCVPLDLRRPRVDAVLLFGDMEPCDSMARGLARNFRLAYSSATGMAKTYLRQSE
jgi:hypothetical protein